MSRQQQRPFRPPEPYSISRGTVTRIEPYGCFVKLESSPVSGLVHISQLHESRITDVNDVVSLHDEVWVKVMHVDVETITDEDNGRERQRHRVKLSMKYVHQDTGQDLDPDNERLQDDMQRGGGSGRGDNGGGRGNAANGASGGADSQLGRALASNIGMSIAIDPGNLILKGKKSGGGGPAVNSSFNGYELVGEDEGEPEMPAMENNARELAEAAKRPEPAVATRPMGRGRGTTLPAWMTRKDDDDTPPGGRLGSMDSAAMPDSTRDKDHNARIRDKRHGKERHHGGGGEKRDGKRKEKKRSKDHHHRRRGRDRRYSRSRSRSSHRSPSSSPSVASRSRGECRRRSRSRSHRDRHGRQKKRKKHDRHRRRSRGYSRSRSRSRSHSSSREEDSQFANAEEARAIVERFERQRRGDGMAGE